MDPRDYWQALRKSWIVIIALAIVGGVVAYGYGQTKPDVFQSTSSVFVSATQGSTTDQLSQGSTFTHNVVASYATLATTPAVLTPVIDELGLATTPIKLARTITASNPLNTVFVQITVSSGSATGAADIANAVARSLRTVSTNLAPATAAGTPSITMSIVAPAQVPAGPKSPNRHLIEITGAVIGLVAGVLFAIARLLFDTRLRTSRDIETSVETPLIGTIRRRKHEDPKGIALVTASGSAIAEDYRRVRATLQHAGVSGTVHSLLVTSPLEGPESAELALNIALATAERSKRVLVIDADLRSPSLAHLASLPGTSGLTDVLDGSVGFSSAVQSWTGGVDVLTAGSPLSNPHFALGSNAIASLLETVKDDYDLVVVDSPPLLTYSDALTLVHLTDGAIVVATASKTKRPQLIRTLDALEGVRASTWGVVLTGVKHRGHAEEPSTHHAHPEAIAPATLETVPATAPAVEDTSSSPRGWAAQEAIASKKARASSSGSESSPRTAPTATVTAEAHDGDHHGADKHETDAHDSNGRGSDAHDSDDRDSDGHEHEHDGDAASSRSVPRPSSSRFPRNKSRL